ARPRTGAALGTAVVQPAGHVLPALRRAESGWLVYGCRRHDARHGGHRRDAALETLHIDDVGPGTVVSNARADLPDVVHRPAGGSQRESAYCGLLEPLGHSGELHR